MPNQQPLIIDAQGKRQFACSAVAVQAIIVNSDKKVLLLSSPDQNGWQVISGALESEETVLAGALREIKEEAGKDLQVRPLGAVHVETFRYDDNIQYFIGIYYLFAYERGEVVPGDDMQGSQSRWWALDELECERIRLYIPPDQAWILQRAVDLYSLWKDQTIELQRF